MFAKLLFQQRPEGLRCRWVLYASRNTIPNKDIPNKDIPKKDEGVWFVFKLRVLHLLRLAWCNWVCRNWRYVNLKKDMIGTLISSILKDHHQWTNFLSNPQPPWKMLFNYNSSSRNSFFYNTSVKTPASCFPVFKACSLAAWRPQLLDAGGLEAMMPSLPRAITPHKSNQQVRKPSIPSPRSRAPISKNTGNNQSRTALSEKPNHKFL